MVSQCQTKQVMGWTQKHVKKPINLTLRSKFKVASGSWMTRHIVSWWYTHVPNMVSQCQTKKKLYAGHKSAQTDRQGDYFYTPLNFVHRGYNTLLLVVIGNFWMKPVVKGYRCCWLIDYLTSYIQYSEWHWFQHYPVEMSKVGGFGYSPEV